jgi:dihydroorotate dehydrogenase (NAD+) catalytic subunit
MAGATAVQVGTANFSDPSACEKILIGLQKLCVELKVNRIIDLIGAFDPNCA